MATSIACCLSHLVRVALTLAVGRVANFARRWLPKRLRCPTTHCGFPPNVDDLLSVQSCCFANVLLAPRFPSFRPDTASFRSCLLLSSGFLGTREAGICTGSRACFSVLFLLDFSVPVDVCKVDQAAIEQILVKRRWNVKDLQLRKIVSGLSHISGAVLDCLFWVLLGALENHDVLLRCGWFLCLTTTIQRTSSKLIRYVTIACAPMRFPFSHLCLLGRSLSHDRLGLPMEAILDTCDSFKKAYVEVWVFQVPDTSDLIPSRRSG